MIEPNGLMTSFPIGKRIEVETCQDMDNRVYRLL